MSHKKRAQMAKETPKPKPYAIPAIGQPTAPPPAATPKPPELPDDESVVAEVDPKKHCPPCPGCFKGLGGVGVPYGSTNKAIVGAPMAFRCNQCRTTFAVNEEGRRQIVKNFRQCPDGKCGGIAGWTHKYKSGLARFQCWSCGKRFKKFLPA